MVTMLIDNISRVCVISKAKKIVALLIVCCLLFTSCSPKNNPANRAPDFSLKDINGTVFNLSNYKNKIIFLDFWATWCPHCIAAIPAVNELHKSNATNPNVAILSIVNEKQSKVVKQFIKRHKINYDVLLGDDQVRKDYEVGSFPSFFIMDTNGEIVWHHEGYSDVLKKEWDNVIDKLIKE